MDNNYKSFLQIDNEFKSSSSRSIAFLPIGCIEQHGPFLPVETDSILAESITKELALKVKEFDFNSYKFSPIHYTPTKSNRSFTGTISVNEPSFRNYLWDVCKSMLNSCFDAVVLVCTHGPANNSVIEVAFNLTDEQFNSNKKNIKPIITVLTNDWNVFIEKEMNIKSGRHADWREFLLLYKVLGKEYFKDEIIREMREFSENNNFDKDNCDVLGIPVKYRSVSGVIGNPFPFDKDFDYGNLSEKIWSIIIKNSVEKIIEDLSSFEEICKRRKK